VRPKTLVPFPEFAPDQQIAGGASSRMKGVISRSGRLAPLEDAAQIRAGSVMNDACLGGRCFYDSNGFPVAFLGDAGRLYRLNGKIPTDVSKPGGYSGSNSWAWTFEQFGNNIVAVMRGVAPQRFQLGVSSVFADLANAPIGDTVFRVRQHLFIAEGNVLNCSAFNNIEDWEPDFATQAFQTELNQANGLIVAGWSGEQGAVFQERGIARLNYLGGQVPFQIDEIEGGRGLCGPNAWAAWGRSAFCVAEDGFYVFDGMQAAPIGDKRVDRYFSSRLNYGFRQRVWAAVDSNRKCLMIGFPTGAAIEPNEVLIYSWADDKWTHDEIDTQFGFEIHREPVDADDEAGLIELFGTANADDSAFATVSVDSPIFRESRKEWAVVDASRRVCQFTGANRAAELSTGVYELAARKTFISEIWPGTDAEPEDVTATVGTRLKRLSEAETVSSPAQMNDEGWCPVRAEGRYMSATVTISAGAAWTEATGIYTDAGASGER